MIYIDTGAFLARYISHDQYHSQAREGWKKLERTGKKCFTSNFVLNETFTLLARRASYSFAAQRARAILSSEILAILRASQEEEFDALELFEKYADQEVSYTDCISFALMRKHGIQDAFSFDNHFERAGFKLWQKSPV